MYMCQPKGWRDRDLKMLDQAIAAFSDFDPFGGDPSAMPIDLHTACMASWSALHELKKHLASHGRKL